MIALVRRSAKSSITCRGLCVLRVSRIAILRVSSCILKRSICHLFQGALSILARHVINDIYFGRATRNRKQEGYSPMASMFNILQLNATNAPLSVTSRRLAPWPLDRPRW